ncbi:MAG: hypothetical protein A2X86_13260 [Bdellovibrionales bacterium GWA2_49_15]|nr:MAG: hypothetical protein A2X86_13260 [Bdellovibrionales bacterium GWA2_49_15]HAZ13493.1 hypothetical protein [Bdellovibrionales bacterium]
MGKIILFIFCFLPFSPVARAESLPQGVLDLDSLMFEFRGQLERKIQGLFENYIVSTNQGRTLFSSNGHALCAKQTMPLLRTLVTYDYNYELKKGELIERLRYTDCFGATDINELIITKGNNLRPLNQAELRSGRRNFELADNESERRYLLSNSKNEELISLLAYREGNNLRASVRLRGARFLDMVRVLEEGRERYSYTLSGHDIEYKVAYSHWRSQMGMATTTYSALRLKSEDHEIVHYLDANNQPISLQEFQEWLGRHAIESGFQMVGQWLSYHLYTFPSTDFSRSNVQKNRLLEEFNLAYIQLLNNTDLNLVTNFIRAIIDAIGQGLIRFEDHRPKVE